MAKPLANMRELWFGTREHMRWIPMPKIDAPIGTVGWETKTQFLNGGAFVRRSATGHREYQLSWNLLPRMSLQPLYNYAAGLFGPPPYYFIDPFSADLNVLPEWFASPGMGVVDAPILVGTSRPQALANTDFSYEYPSRGALYTVAPSMARKTVYVPIPPGYTFWIGAHGLANAGAFVTVKPFSSPTVSGSTINLTNIGVNSVVRCDTAIRSDDGWIGVEVSVGGTGTLGLFGIIAQILLSATHPTPATIVDKNGVLNPSPQDATQLATGFSAQLGSGGGTMSGARVAGAGVGGGYGYRFTQLTDATVGDGGPQAGLPTALTIAVTAGDPFTPSLYVNANLTRSARLMWAYYDASNTRIGAFRIGTVTVALVANAPHVRIQEPTETVPANITHAIIRVYDPSNGWTGTRTNLFVNPRVTTAASFWNTVGTVTTAGARVVSALDGLPAYQAAVNGAGGSSGITAIASFSATAGQWTGRMAVRALTAPTQQLTLLVRITYTDSTTTDASINVPWSTAFQDFALPLTGTFVAGKTAQSVTIMARALEAITMEARNAIVEARTTTSPTFFDGASGTNLVANPILAANATDYSATGATGAGRVAATYSPNASWAYSGTFAAVNDRIVWSNATVVSAGAYVLSADVLVPAGKQFRLEASSSDGATNYALADLVGTGSLQRVSISFTHPGVIGARLVIRQVFGAIGTVQMTALRLIASTGYLTDDIEYVDPHPKAWTGTVDASTSTRAGDTMTVDRVSTAADPNYFDGTTPNTSTYTYTWAGTAYASVTNKATVPQPEVSINVGVFPGGMGHAGCDMESIPSKQGYSSALDKIGASVNLTEVVGWDS